jgi:hypothetical protein
MKQLRELEVTFSTEEIPPQVKAFIAEGRARFNSINCFDFVPSDYEFAWRLLASLPSGVFCEWGSGIGVIVGLARLAGHEAIGIELDPVLADQSRDFLESQGIKIRIQTGSYYEFSVPADYYYVYCWPGQTRTVQEYFLSLSDCNAKLIFCRGQSELRYYESVDC